MADEANRGRPAGVQVPGAVDAGRIFRDSKYNAVVPSDPDEKPGLAVLSKSFGRIRLPPTNRQSYAVMPDQAARPSAKHIQQPPQETALFVSEDLKFPIVQPDPFATEAPVHMDIAESDLLKLHSALRTLHEVKRAHTRALRLGASPAAPRPFFGFVGPPSGQSTRLRWNWALRA